MKNVIITNKNYNQLTLKKTLKDSILEISKKSKPFETGQLSERNKTTMNLEKSMSTSKDKQNSNKNSKLKEVSSNSNIKISVEKYKLNLKEKVNNKDISIQSLKHNIMNNIKNETKNKLHNVGLLGNFKNSQEEILKLSQNEKVSSTKNFNQENKAISLTNLSIKNEKDNSFRESQKNFNLNTIEIKNKPQKSVLLSPKNTLQKVESNSFFNPSNISQYSKMVGTFQTKETNKPSKLIKVNLRKEILDLNNYKKDQSGSNLSAKRYDVLDKQIKMNNSKLIHNDSNLNISGQKSFFEKFNNSKNFNTSNAMNMSLNQNSKKKTFLEKYKDSLSNFELAEISNLKEIYFYGKDDDCRVSKNVPSENKSEKKIDDEKNYYIINKGDHLNYRFEILDILGKGSFGQAVKCYDHKSKNYVCVKIIRAEEKFSNQAKIEIKILEFLKSKDESCKTCIVKPIESFKFRKHMCIVFHLYDINLYELIRDNDYCGLEDEFLKSVALQMLKALVFLKKYNIIHCDIKPENILLSKWGDQKITLIDFGSSCFSNEKLYSYIQSRYYRAPEIVLGLGYNFEIDMWSFGCLLCELYAGFPIFSGESEIDQLNYFMEYLGIPDEYLLKKAVKRNNFFDSDGVPLKYKHSRGRVRKPNTKKIHEFLQIEESDDLLDLIKKCLVYDPKNRISPEEAIEHKWFKK